MPAEVEVPVGKAEAGHREASTAKWMEVFGQALTTPVDPAPVAAISAPPETEPKPATPPPPKDPATTTTAPPAEEHWPRSAKEWKNFTAAKKAKDEEYQKLISERDARIKEFETKLANPPAVPETVQKELEALKKENDEFSKQLRLVAVTNHPRFKSHFETRINSTLAQLKSCVPADQLETVTKLIQQPDSKAKDTEIDGLMEDMTSLQRGRFLGVINGLSAIQTERDGEIARAQQDYEQMVAAAKTEQEQRNVKFGQLLEETVKTMQDAKAGRPEYQLREGNTEWNESVKNRIESGKKLITGKLPPEVMFKAAFDAAAYPDVLAGYRGALQEIDKLKKQIEKMGAATPRLEPPPKTETNGNPPTALPKNTTERDIQHAAWRKTFGAAMRGEAE